MKFTAHSTSIIDEGAQIGDETRVWHWVHVCKGAKVGARCTLGQNVFIGNDVVIGDNVKIQNNVSVYDSVRIEDDVFCGPSVVFTNVYNPRASVKRRGEYRETLVRKGATLGANATIVCGITVGEFAFVAAGAVVNKNIKAYALTAGVPARQIGWISRHGQRLDLPLVGNAESTCIATGERYLLTGDKVQRVT